jgi:phage virion morphogenesis protein
LSDRFIIELDAEGELQARLGAAIRGMTRPSELMDAIGARMVANVQLRFDTKRAPDGTAWLPAAASTLAQLKRKNGGQVPGSLLERTRRMRDSLSRAAGDASVEWGFGVPYAMPHETGSRRGLPRRQLLTDDPIAGTLAAQDRQDILDEVNDFLQGLLK